MNGETFFLHFQKMNTTRERGVLSELLSSPRNKILSNDLYGDF